MCFEFEPNIGARFLEKRAIATCLTTKRVVLKRAFKESIR